MNSRQPHLRVRPLWAAGFLGCALALVLGFSSAPASARSLGQPQIVLVSTSPAEPTAGQTFTAKFKLMKAGVPQRIIAVNCFAGIAGRPVTVLYQGTDGTIGRCSWAIPAGTSGRRLGGMVAAQHESGVRYYASFDVPIR
jgi:hypothetical protein